LKDSNESAAGVPLIVVSAALGFASGATDVTSLTRLGMVFSSVMTGNLVLFGLAAERASGELASHAAVALASYIRGVAVGNLTSRSRSRDVLWSPQVTAVLVLELAAFAGFTIAWELCDGRPTGGSQFLLLILAALGMGLQSAATRTVGATLSTTYLTGTITSVVAALVTRVHGDQNNRLNLTILGSVTIGAAAGGGLISLAPVALPVLPVIPLLAVVVVAETIGVHQ